MSSNLSRIAGVETIKTADQGRVWLFGRRSKSVYAGLDRGLLAVRPLCL